MHALVIGCGYVGSAVAAKLASQGHAVTGVRRTTAYDPVLEKAGVKLLITDISSASDVSKLGAGFDWVVNCAAPSAGGPEAYQRTYLDGMRNLIAHFEGSAIRKFVYTSSSGVYAQNDGSEVDENSPANPESETGNILLRTETVLLEASRKSNFPGIILRPSGIYGPGRTFWLRMFLSGEAITEASPRYMNMIHRDDLVTAILIALNKGVPGEIYNVTDNEPVTQQDLFRWLAERTGRNLPGSEGVLTPAPPRRTVTNKRISNLKLRRDLDWIPAYPTFREGYAAQLIE